MSIFRNDGLGNWTRGGQAIVHNMRMTTQVFFQVCGAGLALWTLCTAWYAAELTPAYEQYVIGKYVKARFMTDSVQAVKEPILFKARGGREYWTNASAIKRSKVAQSALKVGEKHLLNGALLAGAVTLFGVGFACWYFTTTGRGLGSNQFLRGAAFGTGKQLRWTFRRAWLRRGSFSIGGVPVPHAFETQHFLLVGAPGTGKTNIMGQMLAGVRGRSDGVPAPDEAERGMAGARLWRELGELVGAEFWGRMGRRAARETLEIVGLREPVEERLEAAPVGPRRRHKRAIVFDISGAYVERFYRPGVDQIFNPLDRRSASWSPWLDAKIDYHYEQIAESVVPDKVGDPFWGKAARGTLVAVMRKLAERQQTLTSVLLDVITRTDIMGLTAFVAGTDAAAYISPEGEKTSAGVRAEAASVMKSFAYLDDTEEGISIREWVANERDDSWLFITCKADQLPALRPLITTWLDIAISAIMSLPPDQFRRIFIAVDELASLQRLPSLQALLAMGRKYGGCAILGIQSYPQLEDLYGIAGAASLTGYCSTWVSLRANDNPTAELVSKKLGKVEQIEANEGMSYGVNDMRDGVNLSRMQVTRPLVMDTEVGQLPDLQGFLYFGRNLPVVHFNSRYEAGERREPAFVDRTTPPVRLPEARAILIEVAADVAAAIRDAETSRVAKTGTAGGFGDGVTSIPFPKPTEFAHGAAFGDGAEEREAGEAWDAGQGNVRDAWDETRLGRWGETTAAGDGDSSGGEDRPGDDRADATNVVAWPRDRVGREVAPPSETSEAAPTTPRFDMPQMARGGRRTTVGVRAASRSNEAPHEARPAIGGIVGGSSEATRGGQTDPETRA